MQISKFWFAVALVATATFGAGIATATHVFDDVEDGRFFAEPAEWAANNGITNGCGDGNFCPDDPVTRGENITFAKRYDDNIVQPALADLDSTIEELESQIETAEAAISGLQATLDTAPEVLWATVAPADGSPAIVRGSGAESVAKVGPGYFSVTFDRDVSDCTWTASYGEPDNSGVDAKYATVRGGPTDEEARVVIRDTAGAQADGDGFHLVVVCGPETETVLLSPAGTGAGETEDPNAGGGE